MLHAPGGFRCRAPSGCCRGLSSRPENGIGSGWSTQSGRQAWRSARLRLPARDEQPSPGRAACETPDLRRRPPPAHLSARWVWRVRRAVPAREAQRLAGLRSPDAPPHAPRRDRAILPFDKYSDPRDNWPAMVRANKLLKRLEGLRHDPGLRVQHADEAGRSLQRVLQRGTRQPRRCSWISDRTGPT